MLKTPILFIIFNRPYKTQLVFESIKKVKPLKLYVAADGPREGNQLDISNSKLARDIVSKVDWECEVYTLFRRENLGCKLGVSTSIDWFFEKEEFGIILEDEILPKESFYTFCEEMLRLYKNDDNVGMITGSNLVANKVTIHESYAFSKYPNIWGWATWRRAWQTYDVNLKDWRYWRKAVNFKDIDDGVPFFKEYWNDVLEAVYKRKIDTWDFQWFFNMWKSNLLCIIPKYNLIENIGFDAEATHTDGAKPEYIISNPAQELGFPLNHPDSIYSNKAIDYATSSFIFRISFKTICKNKLRRNKLLGDFLVKLKRIFQNKMSIFK